MCSGSHGDFTFGLAKNLLTENIFLASPPRINAIVQSVETTFGDARDARDAGDANDDGFGERPPLIN